ncbi:hypothetical protein ASE33_25995, partial [Pseudomonas sp. Root9]
VRMVQVLHALWAGGNGFSLARQAGDRGRSVVSDRPVASTAWIKRVTRHEVFSWLKDTHRKLCVGARKIKQR